jgi:hypothetical protein
MNEWIPSSERLPEIAVRCLIATRIPDGHKIEFGEWHGDRWKKFGAPWAPILHSPIVSHWMPLPGPPEVK